MIIFEIIMQSKTNFKNITFINYQPGLLRSLFTEFYEYTPHGLTYIEISTEYFLKLIHAYFFFCKEINLIAVEKLLQLFCGKLAYHVLYMNIKLGCWLLKMEKLLLSKLLWKNDLNIFWSKWPLHTHIEVHANISINTLIIHFWEMDDDSADCYR